MKIVRIIILDPVWGVFSYKLMIFIVYYTYNIHVNS